MGPREWSTIIVDGVDVCAEFGVIYTDESTLGPPEKRTNYVDVPGMDGTLDLTETLTEDMVFGRRSETAVLFVPGGLPFERVKTDLSNFLDGRRFDYTYSFDRAYVRNGRFRVTEYDGWRERRITVEIDAEPWKRGPHMTYVVKGAGGTVQRVENGRRRVIPVVTVQTPTLVMYDADGDGVWDRSWEVGTDEPGSYTIDGLRLRPGTSSIYVNSAPDLCDTTWDDLDAAFGTWEAVGEDRWSEHLVTKTEPPEGAEYDVVVEYDVQDL